MLNRASKAPRKRLLRADRPSDLEELVTSVDGVVWERDFRTRLITFVSRNVERFLGYTAEEFRSSAEFFESIVWPADRGRIEEAWDKIRAGARRLENEYRVVARDGSVRWVHNRITVVDHGAGPVLLRGLAIDATDRKALESRQGEGDKMEAVGRLAGGVAHEFNNLLTTILGNVELIRLTVEADSPVLDHVSDIHDAAERAANLTRQLLAFGRKQMLRFRRMDVSRAVGGACALVGSYLGDTARLRVNADPAAGEIDADPAQIEHVVISLVAFARDGIPDGGSVTVGCEAVTVGEASANALDGLTPGPYVRLTVSDDGPGMSAETLSHLFEPFFSSRGEGVGHGLGLASIYGIVRQCKGCIGVRSGPGEGTTFEMYFPRMDAEA